MRDRNLKNAITSEKASIKEAMRVIDRSGLRVAYVVDENGRLAGVVSDSEIRRAIISGRDVNSSVKNIVNNKPVILKEKDITNIYTIRRKIRNLLQRMPDSRFILLVNDRGFPQKLLSCSKLLGQDRYFSGNIHESGKKILVVGGAGYLGSILVRKLIAEGFKVKVLDILMYGMQSIKELIGNKNFELIEGDMRNISTLVRVLNDVDAVVNLAAIVGDPACKNKPEAAIETNYLANKALAEACKYHQINRFIYSSSCSVYGFMEDDRLLDEKAPLNPISLYARSKVQSEEGILALEDENFSPIILRMATLYGYSPRMRFDLVVNTMTKTAVVDKKIFVHGTGMQWRPFIHVEDAAYAYLQCLRAPLNKVKGEVFNVGADNNNYKIIDIAKIVNKCVPEADFIVEDKISDLRNYFVSFSKLKKQLKYKAVQTLENSIFRIKQAIEEGEIEDVNNSKYYNVECAQ
ncbi:MAG: NAD-dependent epimerase/dehydratase family protein [Candidatus Omnitrophica bacterium]|jgi:nucleoside-diphosphate-sugar epimerase|nr:NAD-dependent epimerase/dehydratase family protein [Candidatus Omnitrophota bacterium]